MKIAIFIIYVAGLQLIGCKSRDKAVPTSNAVRVQFPTTEAMLKSSPRGSARDLQEAFVSRGSVTFRSCDGKYIGMDADSDLTLYPGGRAHMSEYGFAVSEYRGTYAIDGNGIVNAVFPTFEEAYPLLELHRDFSSLFLIPHGDPEYILDSSGTPLAPRWFFPFRQITVEEEKRNPPSPDK